jgi:hypothetical protein
MCVDVNFECSGFGSKEDRWCDEDQRCYSDPETTDGICRDLPPHADVGTITLTGFKKPIVLTPDTYDRYMPSYALTGNEKNDLFDDGDVLTATTEGGALPPLSFSTKGVAPLEIENQSIEMIADSSAVVTWTPADPDSRIQIAVMAGSHDPNPLSAAILCDVPDSDGSVEIPANLINGFLAESCGEALMKCSRITRYTRDVQTINGKEVELFVGSARNLMLSVWY